MRSQVSRSLFLQAPASVFVLSSVFSCCRPDPGQAARSRFLGLHSVHAHVQFTPGFIFCTKGFFLPGFWFATGLIRFSSPPGT
jgi:hypothetical protein